VEDVVNGPGEFDEAGELDELDAQILARLAGLHDRLDGPPDDFDERIVFAVAAAGLDAELARLEEQDLAAARTNDESARTMSFEASSLTILLTITELVDDRVRLDGWLAPGAAHTVLLRSGEGAADRSTLADDTGRFVLDRVRRGLTQLVVRPEGGRSVVTPAFEL
jgi:hypothetical protein